MSAWRRRGASRSRGRPQIYTDTAIECALVVRAVFHLSLRATQEFLASVVRLMDVDLPLPCTKAARHVVIDTTGLEVFGADE